MEQHRKKHGERLDREERLYVCYDMVGGGGERVDGWEWGGPLHLIILSSETLTSFPPPQPTHPPLRRRKKEAREVHRRSQFAQKVHGLRAKLYNAKRYKEKAQMRKTYVVRWEGGGGGGRGDRSGQRSAGAAC